MNPSDYSTISFPFLGLELDPGRVLKIGPLSIHFYGAIIALGLILAVVYALRRSKQFGIKEDDIIDGVLWIVPFAILCARLYYCAFRWEEGGYAANPLSVLYIWKGGLAIYGGVIGAVIGVAVHCRIKRINMPALMDMVCLGFLIGQSLGRWGNFFNREAFGAATDSFFRMGLFNTRTGAWEYYHPTFLYESLWNILGFVLLTVLYKKKKFNGQIALTYFIWYGFGRFFIEGLRTDSLYIFKSMLGESIRVSQMVALITVLGGAILMIVGFRHAKYNALEHADYDRVYSSEHEEVLGLADEPAFEILEKDEDNAEEAAESAAENEDAEGSAEDTEKETE